MKRALVLGSGAREQAIAYALSKSPGVDAIYLGPGNAGTEFIGKGKTIFNMPELDRSKFASWERFFGAVDAFVRKYRIDLTVPGSETFIVNGIADHFLKYDLQQKGHFIFAPHSKVSLEGSKAEQKQVARMYGIPTAASGTFADPLAAKVHLKTRWSDGKPLVIKADGLQGGKGVSVPDSLDEALAAVDAIDGTLLIEERLYGDEISVMAFCDGKTVRTLPVSRDHKRLLDGDKGPNTGGMGAYAPVFVPGPVMEEIENNILRKLMASANILGHPYIGIIYAGIMLTKNQGSVAPKLLEVNCRFGDPEAQAVLPLLKTDLYDLMMACVQRRLREVHSLSIAQGHSCVVVMASEGYPEKPKTGRKILGLEDALTMDGIVFHAGTAKKKDGFYTNGGRVLSVAAQGQTFRAAVDAAYEAVGKISFEGEQHRRDIGADVLGKPSSKAIPMQHEVEKLAVAAETIMLPTAAPETPPS